jgi:phosphonate transport system ATP-binding protein
MQIHAESLSARHPASRKDQPATLQSVSLSLRAGEQVAVIGASGAGKTTLLHVLACALPPESGRFDLDGVDPWRLSTAKLQVLRGRLYLAPQVPPLPPRQRVVTSLLAGSLPAMGFFRSLRSLFYPVDIAGADAALRRFDLSEKLFERVDRLSGGERQRVGLARALLSPATLWLIDEPLSALDPTRSEMAINTLTDEARARNVTLVATLHQVETALKHFDRIIGLQNGVLEFDRPSGEVTPAMLQALYRNHPEELGGPAVVPDALGAPPAPAPVVMHCR